jgi:2-C-methyl-D-erythritol 4-phosphate cytidylyltransferase
VRDRRRDARRVGPDRVLVHDAARPLLPDDVVERLLAPLSDGWDGAVPGLPLADTVKRVDGDRVLETLARGELVAVQTPQAFVADVLRDAVAAGDEASDCSTLVEARGGRVKVVPGDRRLLKVTTRDDLGLVSSWLE